MWIQRLRSSFKKFMTPSSAPLMGFLGNRSGTVPTGTTGFVYVTLQSSGQTIVARNTVVPMIPGLAVVVVRDPSNNYRVDRVFDIYPTLPYPEQSQPDTSQMTWPGASTIWVRDAQILDGVPIPIPNTLSVQVYGRWYFLENLFHVIDHTIIDMTSELPASGAEWVNVEIDSAGVVSFLHGSNASTWEILTPEDVPISDSTKYFLFSVRMYVGQTQIRKVDGPDCDLFDPRFTRIGSGGSGGGTPGGNDTTVQINNAGSFDGNDNLTYASAVQALRMGLEILGFESALTSLNALIQVGDSDSHGNFQFVFSDDLTDSAFDTAIRAGGTKGSPTKVLAGMVVRRWRGRGWFQSGENFSNVSQTTVEMLGIADGDWSSTSQPTKFEFYTTPVGSTTKVLALTIGSDGYPNLPTGMQWRVGGAQHTHVAADVSGIREVLSANRTYYIRTDGSDSNNGLANTSGGAFLTIQKAINVIKGTLDLAGYTVTIQIADGTYTTTTSITPWVGGGQVTIQGNSTTPSNVLISVTSNDCFSISGVLPGILHIKDLKIVNITAGSSLAHYGYGQVNISNIDFGSSSTAHFSVLGKGAYFNVTGNYAVSGGAPGHWSCDMGTIRCNGWTITITGTPAFTYFARCIDGMIKAISNTFSGSATGPRYYVNLNGVIDTNGGGATYLPGNSAGSTATGGQYA